MSGLSLGRCCRQVMQCPAGERSFGVGAGAATHDAAVKMIDTSIIRVQQHAACITRNVETTGRAEAV